MKIEIQNLEQGDNNDAKICLNMIVKNESNIITRLFDSVINVIDSYCICDTGSTDNTIELIKEYFFKKGIPGKIVSEPFQDFGYNRTYALKQCEGEPNADYLLLLDADMILDINNDYVSILKQQLWNYNAHYVFQGSDSFYYKNVRFVKNNMNFSYWGVTHEYVKVPEGTEYGFFEKNDVFINDIGDGGSKQNKFLRDIDLLNTALEKTPNNDRYTFYLANSYRDSGQIEKAAETYKKRIQLGGWVEEVWHSYLSLGRCYKSLDNMKEAIFYWLEGYNYFPKRIENLYEIIEYYRNKGQNNIAYEFYNIACKIRDKYFKEDYLFLEKNIYDYKLDYEMSIIGYYCNPENYDMSKLSTNLMNTSTIEEWMYRNILSNYKFYTDSISNNSEYPIIIYSSTQNIFSRNFKSSSPSMIIQNNNILFNIRYVNYYINEKGEYIQDTNIKTINVMFSKTLSEFYELIKQNKTNENIELIDSGSILQYDESYDNFVYVGMEDLRLFSYKDKILYTTNRGLSQSQIVVECGEIVDNKTINSNILLYEKQNNIEKNWVLFEDCNGNLKCIYKWFPLIIGEINYDLQPVCKKFEEFISIPLLRHVRGSTNGIIVDDEIWFICHVVSYEERRYYYHILIILDKDGKKIKRFSRLFTFEKEKVEYCLGFVYDKNEDKFIIGYSTMDNSTKFMLIPKEKLERMVLA